MKKFFLTFAAAMLLCSCATKPWYYEKPYYTLTFVTANGDHQYGFKLTQEEVDKFDKSILNKLGWYEQMTTELVDSPNSKFGLEYGHWIIEGPLGPLNWEKNVAYQNWLEGK